MMEGIYEVRSTETPVYVNSCSPFSVPLERNQQALVSNSTMATTTCTTVAFKPSNTVVSSSLLSHTAKKGIISPPSPNMVDTISQTDLTGAPEVKDVKTQTSDVFVPVDELCPPSLPLDSLGM